MSPKTASYVPPTPKGLLVIESWEKLPSLELYVDQVLTLCNEQFATLRNPEERLISPSMVNNYVKQGLLSAPIKKRYRREQISRLFMIILLKSALCMADISQLLEAISALPDMDDAALHHAFRIAVARGWQRLRQSQLLPQAWAEELELEREEALPTLPNEAPLLALEAAVTASLLQLTAKKQLQFCTKKADH